MKITLDEFERDLLIESLEYRIESDEELTFANSIKEDLQDLIRKIEDEYI